MTNFLERLISRRVRKYDHVIHVHFEFREKDDTWVRSGLEPDSI